MLSTCYCSSHENKRFHVKTILVLPFRNRWRKWEIYRKQKLYKKEDIWNYHLMEFLSLHMETTCRYKVLNSKAINILKSLFIFIRYLFDSHLWIFHMMDDTHIQTSVESLYYGILSSNKKGYYDDILDFFRVITLMCLVCNFLEIRCFKIAFRALWNCYCVVVLIWLWNNRL